ncbi:MAG TPA: hypothetical protein VGH15_05925 [Caulobacteraceae bacterium]
MTTGLLNDGIEVVTTVLAAAKTYDLTDLATVHDELSIPASKTSDDTWLGRAIGQVSRLVMSATNRVFAPELVQDLFDLPRGRYQVPSNSQRLQLARWPIIVVASVVQTSAEGVTSTLVEGTDFRVDYAVGQLLRLDATTDIPTPWEPLPLTVAYVAGYGAAVTETHVVPATPFQVTVSQASTFSCDQSVSYNTGVALARVTGTPGAGQYSVAAGVYTFSLADVGQDLTFAYATAAIPLDLVDVALRLVAGRFRARGRDPALIQRDTPSVGTERFWFGGAPGQKGAFTPDIQAVLDTYRVPVAAT